MINKSNQSMVQLITVLEQKNKYLEQQNAELNKYILNLQVKFDETNKFLEKRITDFTDIWHPMMMQNINRIKDELVQSIKKSNDTEVENKLAFLNDKIESIQLNNLKSKIDEISKQLNKLEKKFDDTGLEGNTVVSYDNITPYLINTNMLLKLGVGNEMVTSIRSFYHNNMNPNPKFIMDKIKHFKNKCDVVDFAHVNQMTFYDENFNEIYMGPRYISDKCIDFNGIRFDILSMKKLLKTLDNINPNIKLKYGSLETYNGIPIRKYIELFF